MHLDIESDGHQNLLQGHFVQDQPFTPQERQEIIKRFHELDSEYETISEKIDQLSATQRRSADERLDSIYEDLQKLRDRYRSGLPQVVIARCPVCKSLVNYWIDLFGIDGFWWDKNVPLRRPEPNKDEHFLAISGAVQLNGPIPESPFLTCTGPQAPFVIPRLLEVDGVLAVMSKLEIGEHTGFPIVYFADPYPLGTELTNEWGSNYYRYWNGERNDNGERSYSSSHSYDFVSDYDFELAKWLDQGKLLWIDPNDKSFKLHRGSAGCPFLNLTGPRKVTYTRNGVLWLVD